MNKILLLGHPSSGVHHVEQLLQQSGMQPALPSRREALKPADITATLCQAHHCPPVEEPTAEDDFAPVQAGAIWHSLALDLVLGNLEQPVWGWSDTRTIFWLDYWASLDPHATFLMVFDHPSTALQHLGQRGISAEQLDLQIPQALENWQAYNGALLRFYSRNPSRCLLVNASHARDALNQYLVELGNKLHGNTPMPLQALALPGLRPGSSVPDELKQAIAQGSQQPEQLLQWFEPGTSLEQHLLAQVLQQYPQALQVYSELQAASTVAQPASTPAHGEQAAQAWLQLVEQRQAIAHLTHNLHQQMLQQQANKTALQITLAQESQRLVSIEQALSAQTSLAQDAQQENELLLTQLHQVQEELERVFLSRQDLEKQASHTQAQAQALQVKTAELSKTLEEKIKAQQAEANAKAKAQAQVQALQAEKAQLAKAKEAEAAAKQTEADAKAQAQAQLKQLLAEQNKLTQALEAAQKTAATSPKQIQELQEENELLLTQLHQVQEELERYFLENKQLKASAPKLQPPTRLYGAADIVKQQLPYRLGATMLANSRSPLGWLRMPIALVGQARQHRRRIKAQPPQAHPPLHTYTDAHEGERCQQHLSYRLGNTMLKHIKTPWGWLWLPIALGLVVRSFKKART